MTTSYPGSVDNFTNPTGTDATNASIGGRTHAQMHADENDAIEAIQGHVLAGAPIAPSVKTADYTAVLTDAGKTIEFNSGTAKVLTIPPSSSVAWVAGTVINVYQAGAGNVSVAAGAGVTIRNLAALRGQYAEASLRYRGSDEWVLAGDLASSAAASLKDYDQKILTAGDINLNQSAVTAVNTTLDLTLVAAAGDLIEYGISAMHGAGAVTVCYDVYTIPSGTAVNPFGVGMTAGLTDNKQGVPGWEIQSANSNYERLSGSATRVLVAGDVASGTTVLRLYYAKLNTSGRTLFANADCPLKVWAKNYGQV